MFRVFRDAPAAKVVYIAPMKALVRERIADWKQRFERQLGKKVGLRDSTLVGEYWRITRQFIILIHYSIFLC